MKPTLEEAIGQLGRKTEPPSRLKVCLEAMITEPPVHRHHSMRVGEWLRVGVIGAAILGGSLAAGRLHISLPPAPARSSGKAQAQQTIELAYKQFWLIQKKDPFILMGGEVYERLPKPDPAGRRMRPLTGYKEIQARRLAVIRQKSALTTIHRALTESFLPPRQEIYTINDYSSDNPFDKYYVLGELLCASGQSKADAGDFEGAINEALSAIELGTKVEKGVQWRGWQEAGTTRYRGYLLLDRLQPKLSPAQAKNVAVRLERLEMRRAALSQMFHATRWAAYRTFQAKSWEQCMFDFVISYGPRSTLALKATPKTWIIAEHLRYLEALEDRAKKPYGPTAFPVKAPLDAFNQYMAPCFDTVFRDDLLFRASAALVIARLHRRADPKAVLPEDPFAPGKALRERIDGLIYSVGPDGVDNGGVPLARLDSTGDITRLL